MSEEQVTEAAPESGGDGDSHKLGGDAEESHLFEIYKAEGNALVKGEKFVEALQKYEEAWVHCRSDDDRAMILNNRGVVYEKTGDVEKAIKTFNEALELKPEYTKVLIRRGLVHKKQKKFDEAIDDITEAHALAVKNEQTIAGLHDVMNEMIADYAEAELERLTTDRHFDFPRDQFIRTYFRQFYCDPVSRIWKGLDPFPRDENDNVDPTNGFMAAITCMKNGKYSEVSQHCTEEINAGGIYRFEAYLLRGSILFLSGEKEAASSDFKAVYEAPEASPQLKSCAYLKAALLENLWSTPQNAANSFASAEQLWSENADVYYHAALCLVDKGEAIPALALLEKGQEVCPDPKKFPLLHVMALTIRVSYDICTGNPEQALSRLRELESEGVFDIPECFEYYAQTMLLLQNKDEAERFFDKAKEASGGEMLFELKKDGGGRKVLTDSASKVVMAQQVLNLDPEATLAALQPYEEDESISNAVWYHKGEMYFLLGKKEEGFSALDKSIERSFCVYDMKIRVLGKADFTYNVTLAEKLKKHGVKLIEDSDEQKNNALE